MSDPVTDRATARGTASVTRKLVRRKRGWYVRRLRVQRTLVAVVVGLVIAAVCWQNAAHYLALPRIHASQLFPSSFGQRPNIRQELARAAGQAVKPAHAAWRNPNVYPYSIVPGGLKDVGDLKYATQRDYVVRGHYAHFNFNRAHFIRVTQPRAVYLSYRIRDAVYWTHKKVLLHAGELLVTDGKTTARARCGNQISDTAKPDVSDEEPADDILDQPVAGMVPGRMPALPMFRGAELDPFDPGDPKLFATAFLFPYVPISAPLPGGRCPAGEVAIDGRCHKPAHRPVVPEPSTMLLASSGLAFLLWRYRQSLQPARVKPRR